MNNITMIIPVYNEENGINDTICDLKLFADKNKWNIIVVNDGSTDNTSKILKKINWITVVNHPYNKGYGAALKTGIKNANTDLIAFFDGDGQHNPEDLKKLVENFGNFDMIVGERIKSSHREWIRRPGKWILSKIANFLSGKKIPDLNSGLRVIKREVLSKLLHLMPDGFSFSTTSTIALFNMGYSVGYYPITVKKRQGKSSVRQIKHGSSTILLILRLIVLFNPLKIFLPVSFFLLTIGIIYEILYGIIFIPQGVRLIPAALLLILSSILVFFFGLVVDQISEMRKYLTK